MTKSILVVDFGSYETTAAVVTEEQIQAVACPPAIESQLDTRYLSAVIAEAANVAQMRIDRLALAIPTSFGRDEARRDAAAAMAAEAGYPDVELISDAVAAVLDPQVRPDLPDNGLILVCDLGVSWSTTLVRLDPQQPQQLAEETAGDNLTRAGLDILAESALRWLAASCRAVVARAGAHMGEVAAVAPTATASPTRCAAPTGCCAPVPLRSTGTARSGCTRPTPTRRSSAPTSPRPALSAPLSAPTANTSSTDGGPPKPHASTYGRSN